MTTKRLGVIMNGVTGRMGLNQHLIRSIVAIRDEGGVLLSNGDRMMPDPILVGRDADKVERLAKRFNIERWTTDLDKALALLEETVQLEPTNATAHYRLATLYRKMGRADDAKREMELYKKFKEMKEKLNALYKELQVQPKEIRADEQDEP